MSTELELLADKKSCICKLFSIHHEIFSHLVLSSSQLEETCCFLGELHVYSTTFNFFVTSMVWI